VISTTPASGTLVPYGSTVVVVISKGPDLVKVPNVFNFTFDQASIKLEALGFQISTVGSFRLSDRVHQQSPAALTMAPRGSTVTISR
jgi:eukaryotic-like serine/threonine-protein kinase